MKRPTSHNSESGFALLTVMIVMGIIAIMVSGMMYRQTLSIQRSANMLHQAQAFAVTWGLENWVKTGLALDAEKTKIDSLNELWARPMMPVDFEGGTVSGQLFDQQGLLNVNNLDPDLSKNQTEWKAIFTRYFNQKNIHPNPLDVIIDWVDADNKLSPQGAESDYYLLQNPPYRCANQKLVRIETLKLMRDMTPKQFDAIKKDFSALPTVTPVNVNTATKGVLVALAEGMTPDTADAWIAERKEKPAQTINDFNRFLHLHGIQATLSAAIISVDSDFFTLKAKAVYGDTRLGIGALFQRQNKSQVALIQRWMEADED
ncbi:MAG: type II secretion system minor pseudopilin GspK [Hydrogenovibrio sp.]|nr:type II secretion system minor pseudopilin GspK [Hydrogenovibrio sp.]